MSLKVRDYLKFHISWGMVKKGNVQRFAIYCKEKKYQYTIFFARRTANEEMEETGYFYTDDGATVQTYKGRCQIGSVWTFWQIEYVFTSKHSYRYLSIDPFICYAFLVTAVYYNVFVS